MSARLVPQPWMVHSATKRVMAALSSQGGPDCARFVGGCVRDALLGGVVIDIDIATTLTPDEVTTALTEAEIKAIPTGVAHGTITAATEGKVFEITTLRRDIETDGRRAKVAFTDDWARDAARRDFRFQRTLRGYVGRGFRSHRPRTVRPKRRGRRVRRRTGNPDRRGRPAHPPLFQVSGLVWSR